MPFGNRSFAEFFAGVGLVRQALEQGGWQCNFANDIDSKKFGIYQDNFSAEHYVVDDIWNIEPSQIPQETDLFTASFPCVDLSVAGGRKGIDAERSGTFWALIKLLEQRKADGSAPKFVLLENVYGFLTTNNGQDLKTALLALNKLQYSVDVFVVNATHFTPQSRVRIFVMAVDKQYENASIIRRTDHNKTSQWSDLIHAADPAFRPKRLLDFIMNDRDCDWFTTKTPKLPNRNISLDQVIEYYPTEHGIWWEGERHERVVNQMPALQLDYLRSHQHDKALTYGTIYRRMRKGRSTAELRVDGIAGCLRTPRGGSSKQILARTGLGKVLFRHLTPREYARLQGVSDEFILAKRDTDSYFAMGDAVCVPAVRWIVDNYINAINC